MKPMPPPDMPPSIQKPQKSSPNCLARAGDEQLGVEIARPRNDGLERAEEISAGRARRCARMSPRAQLRRESHRECRWPAAGAVHSASQRRRYFSVTISRIGPTFCAMPPWTSTRLSCSFSRSPANPIAPEHGCVGQQAAAADAVFRIAVERRRAFDQLDPRPHSAGVLPAAARTADPLAEDRARGDDAALVFLQLPASA